MVLVQRRWWSSSGFGIQIILEQAFPLITLHHLFLWLWLYPLVPVPHTTGSIGEPLYKLSYYFTVLVIGLVCILTPHSFLTGTVRALYLLIAEFYLNYRAFLSYLCTIGTLDGTTRAFSHRLQKYSFNLSYPFRVLCQILYINCDCISVTIVGFDPTWKTIFQPNVLVKYLLVSWTFVLSPNQ